MAGGASSDWHARCGLVSRMSCIELPFVFNIFGRGKTREVLAPSSHKPPAPSAPSDPSAGRWLTPGDFVSTDGCAAFLFQAFRKSNGFDLNILELHTALCSKAMQSFHYRSGIYARAAMSWVLGFASVSFLFIKSAIAWTAWVKRLPQKLRLREGALSGKSVGCATERAAAGQMYGQRRARSIEATALVRRNKTGKATCLELPSSSSSGPSAEMCERC